MEALIYALLEATESPRASEILKNWSTARGQFWVVVPHPAAAGPGAPPVNEPEKSSQSASSASPPEAASPPKV